MNVELVLRDGAIAGIGFAAIILGLLWVNPRLFMRHAPAAVRESVPPLSPRERRMGLFGGLVLIVWSVGYTAFATFRFVGQTEDPGFAGAFLHATGIAVVVNLVDWLLIDWLLFRAVYPEWMVIPGTYDMPDYRKPAAWARDFYGAVVGTVGGALVALPIAWIAVTWHGSTGVAAQGGAMGQEEHDKRVDYVEFVAADMGAVKSFYSGVFGWSFEDWGDDYVSFEDGRLAGGFRSGEPPAEAGSLVVIYAVDLEAVEEAVRSHGGEIVQEIFSFPGGRRFHFKDPAGNELAVWSDR